MKHDNFFYRINWNLFRRSTCTRKCQDDMFCTFQTNNMLTTSWWYWFLTVYKCLRFLSLLLLSKFQLVKIYLEATMLWQISQIRPCFAENGYQFAREPINTSGQQIKETVVFICRPNSINRFKEMLELQTGVFNNDGEYSADDHTVLFETGLMEMDCSKFT